MIKHLRIFLALVLLMAVSAAKAQGPYYQKIGDIYYSYTPTGERSLRTATASKCTNEYIYKCNIPDTVMVDYWQYGQSFQRAHTVTSIGYSCFKGLKFLSKVTLPETIEMIGESSFKGCTSLESIDIQKANLQDSCFSGCTDLRSVHLYNSRYCRNYCFSGCSRLEKITFPCIESLGKGCFEGCTSLTNITIPNSVTELGEECFEGCTSLASVTIPNSVTELGNMCFDGCTSLKSVTIPSSVTSLRGSCFAGCTSLTSITIPNSVTELGDYCFKGCTSLKSVTIPNSVTELGFYCFSGCTSLTSVTIPNSVTYIGSDCFQGCTSLTSVTIPNSVTYISDCFQGCTSLKEVTCLADTPPITSASFEDEAEKTLYVPAASVDAYKSSSYEWKYFGKVLPVNTSGIKTVSKDDIGMSVDNSTLTLSNVPENEAVNVYSTTGQLLGTGKGNLSVDAQGAQMVIVKVGGKSYKVLVK